MRGVSAFAQLRWVVAASALMTGTAMLIYPGGTAFDPTTHGYSLFRNFLSDLGSTTTTSGQSNLVGATLFSTSLVALALALVRCLIALLRLNSTDLVSRVLTRAAVVVGAVACASIIGIAAAPENHSMAMHIRFTGLVCRTLPVASLLMAFATMRGRRFAKRAVVAWAALTLVLAGHAAFMQWGPPIVDDRGLAAQASEQKVFACIALLIFVFLTLEADRAADSVRRAATGKGEEAAGAAPVG